jgi:hypothetical protein
VTLLPCHKDVTSFILFGIQGKVSLQSECKKNGLEQRQTQNGGRDAKLLF